jgi:hypothetical protein
VKREKKFAKLYIAQQKLQVYFAKHPISQKIRNRFRRYVDAGVTFSFFEWAR